MNQEVDSFTQSMLNAEKQRNKETRDNEADIQPLDLLTFPSPYSESNALTTLNCLQSSPSSISEQNIYSLLSVDEYYGELTFFDNMCYFGKWSDGIFGSSFDDNAEPQHKGIWEDISAEKSSLIEARRYFQGMLGLPLYGVSDINKLQQEKQKLYALHKVLNQWESVDVDNLGSKNQILSTILADFENGDSSDYWITLIAFTGFGAHRTRPFKQDDEHRNAYFVNDVSFLGQYKVRSGYERYGAAAYFNQQYHLTQIFLSDTNSYYFPPNADNTGSTQKQWEHAKWAWKVS